MAKYHGYIGYGVDTETYPGVWEDVITERDYTGDVLKNRTNIQQNATVSASLTLNNYFSIIGDEFAFDNVYSIRYVTYLNKKFKVTGVEIERPRLILTVGGLYNG